MLELSPYATREDVMSAMVMASELERRRCETDFGFFARRFWHVIEPGTQYIHGAHIEAIVDHLDACLPRVSYDTVPRPGGGEMKVRKVEPGQIRKLLINMPPRHMKLLADETPVPTPDGIRRHGDLQVGDRVFGSDGLPSTILAISADAVADVEVELSTGEIIKCNRDHLWTVFDRASSSWRTVDTACLLRWRGGSRSRFFLPLEPVIQFPDTDLPLDPYFLGCWLGDGSSSKPCITHDSGDHAHIDKIISRGLFVSAVCSGGTVTYFSHQGVIQSIRRLGIFNAKRIPESYFSSSFAQRLELLAGLIDTDGSVCLKTSRVRYCTCDDLLALDVERLCYSLGLRPYTVSVPAPGYGSYASLKTAHQVCFQPFFDIPTAIPRKRVSRLVRPVRTAIVSVRESEFPSVGHCISVDRDDGLYLAGRTHVLTHNSTLVSVLWPSYVWTQHPEFRWLFTSYSKALAVRDTMRMRSVIMSPHYQFLWASRFRMLADQNEKSKFFNTSMGYRVSGSVESGVTGEGGDGVICFPYEERVRTEFGPMAIGEIVERRLDVRVWSRDPVSGDLSLQPISGWRKNPGSPLVRVVLPGGLFRCTPSHEALTRDGMIPALDLRSSHALPSFSFPDSGDDCLVDLELARQAAIGLGRLQDFHDILFCQLGVRLSFSLSDVGGFAWHDLVLPCVSVSDRSDVPRIHPELSGEFIRRLVAFQEAVDLLLVEFRIGRSGSSFQPLGSDCVGDVLASGSVGQVCHEVVQRISVQVASILSLWPGPDECLCDSLVHETSERLVFFANACDPVSFVGRSLHQSSRNLHGTPISLGDSCDASDFSVARNIVEPFESGDLSPLDVRFFGHCVSSYCLTVAPHHNFMLCVGGDNIIVSNCDDPMNVADADSEKVRETTDNWWFESMTTRLNNPATGFHVAVFQRVHEKDLAAKCIERGYVHLNLPARYDPKRSCVTVLGWKDWRTEEGELLWPDRFNEPIMASLEKDLGAYGTASQLQQDPKPRGGAFIKREWFKRIDQKVMGAIKGSMFWVRGWDLALNADGDLIAGVEAAFDGDGNLYLRRGAFWHLDMPESLARIELIGRHEKNAVVVEAIGTTRTMGLQVKSILRGHCLVTTVEDKENKVSMAMPWVALAEAGKVFLVEEADNSLDYEPVLRGEWPFVAYNKVPWIERFLDVATSWKPDPTLSQVDDPIDAVSLVYAHLRQYIPLDKVLVSGVAPASITDGHVDVGDDDEDADFGIEDRFT